MEKGEQEKLYLHVIERLKQDIDSGKWKADERLPSEFELAKGFGVSLSTLRKALQILEVEKVIVRKHGVGIFINPKPLFTSGIEELSSVTEMIQQAGMEPGTILLDVTKTDVADDSITRFNYVESDQLITIKRLRTADGQPVVYCVDQVLAKNFPGGTEELLKTSIFDAIEQFGSIRITQAVAQIEPIGYDDEASALLRCGIEVPLLALIQQHYSDDSEMVLYSKNYFRADKFRFHVIRQRV